MSSVLYQFMWHIYQHPSGLLRSSKGLIATTTAAKMCMNKTAGTKVKQNLICLHNSWIFLWYRPHILFVLTHWGRDNMAAVSQTTLSNAFSWMKMLEFRLRFHWSLFLRVQLTIIQHWFRKWLGAGQATSHYLNQWWLVYWRIYASLGLNEFNTTRFENKAAI